MDASDNFWLEVFPAQTGAGRVFRADMRVLTRNGRPFILLPSRKRAARWVLSLYPAQTPRARAARLVWDLFLRAGLPVPGSRRVAVPLCDQDPFVQFLTCQTATTPEGSPCFGILAGNPAAPGRRFMLLACDRDARPVAVVKTGLTDQARELLAKEEQFLKTLAGRREVPEICGSFECSRLRALSLRFCPGDSPRESHPTTVAQLLGSWVDGTRYVQLGSMPDWLRLRAGAAGCPHFRKVDEVASRSVRPVLHHGDFAPWNIRVSPAGQWTVLDWERGESTGIPTWDWLHFFLQPKILVEHRGTSELVRNLEEFLKSDSFADYARLTGVVGLERQLALAYMLYTIHVIQPAEGLQEMKALANRYGGA